MRVLLLGFLFSMLGCAGGNCRQVAEQEKMKTAAASEKSGTLPVAAANAPVVAAEEKNILPTDTVRVFKYDGSLQCGMGKAISLVNMQKDLKGIQVISAENKADGLMHMTVCGGNTGTANVYTILKKDLAAAKKAGFREWTFD